MSLYAWVEAVHVADSRPALATWRSASMIAMQSSAVARGFAQDVRTGLDGLDDARAWTLPEGRDDHGVDAGSSHKPVGSNVDLGSQPKGPKRGRQ